ncbi:MAG TPA: hypothetical protein VMI54_12115 [Polyangiaceae bacterium]|nr:hypothetical protein [Polyangiaceae bacterium]
MNTSPRPAVVVVRLLLLLVLSAANARALEGARDHTIVRAVFAEQRLWLLDAGGSLTTLKPGGKSRLPSALPNPVLDVCSAAGHLEALMCANDPCSRWMLVSVSQGHWVDGPLVSSEGDGLPSLACTPNATLLVTNRRAVRFAGSKISEHELSRSLDPRAQVLALSPDHVLLGTATGEFIGGLLGLDMRSGLVSLLGDPHARDANGTEGCGGLLNPNCVSVAGMAAEPWHPGCAAVAVGSTGLVTGGIWEVCGDEVRQGFVTLASGSDGRRPGVPDRVPLLAVGYAELVRSGNDLWASNASGLFRFHGSLTPAFVPFPKTEAIDGLFVSFAVPGLVLVDRVPADGEYFSNPLLVPTR